MSSAPISIEVPHRLGRDAAIARLNSRIGELPGHIPGGMARVSSSWPSENVMALAVETMGQTIAARLEVEETVVRVQLVLPPLLGFFSGMISAAVREGGTRLLEDKS